MNTAFSREIYRLGPMSEDLRPSFEASLGRHLQVLWRRRYLAALIFLVITGGTVAASFLLPKSYIGQALIQLQFDAPGQGAPLSASGPPVSINANALVEGEAEIIRSRTVARRVFKRLADAGLQGNGTVHESSSSVRSPADASGEDGAAEVASDRNVIALLRGLSVQNDGKSYLIRVTYTANDPERAAILANAFAEEYLRSRVESSFAAAKRTSEWLASQVDNARKIAAESDDRVRQFRQGSATLLAGGGDTSAAAQQLQDAVAQLSNARFEKLRLAARLDRLQKTLQTNRIPSTSDLDGTGAAQQLIAAEVKARADIDQIAASVGVKHPLYIKAKTALDDVHARLMDAIANSVANAEADLESARVSEKSLEAEIETIKRAVASSATAAKRLAELEQDAETARANVDRLAESYRQANALAELKPIPAELVSQAEPLDVPASPKKSLFAVLGAVGGVFAALGAIILLEIRQTGFATSDEVAAHLSIPCLAMVPSFGKRLHGDERQVREKALKLLAVEMGLLGRSASHAIVAVTSALPNEGKTELMHGLANVLAQAGRRALVIDSTPNGGTNAERASDARRLVAVKSVTTDEGMGAVSYYHRTASDLSSTFDHPDRFHSWLKQNASHFDVVLCETPPIMLDAQALVIARAAKLVLCAVRWKSTPRSTIMAAVSQLTSSSSCPEIAAVITEVDLKRHRRAGYQDSLYFYTRFSHETADRTA